MQQNTTNFFECAQKYSIREACLEELNQCRSENGFICPKCGYDKSCQQKHRQLYECDNCGCLVSPPDGTVLEHARLQLPKWFTAICLMGVDEGVISVEQHSKMNGLVDHLSNGEEVALVHRVATMNTGLMSLSKSLMLPSVAIS